MKGTLLGKEIIEYFNVVVFKSCSLIPLASLIVDSKIFLVMLYFGKELDATYPYSLLLSV